ncbi:MAG: argininosuccinate lyase [Bdellovibrionales bacterium]|nr:argininosuccinate lyase [Bdellovibrionales bacterium]
MAKRLWDKGEPMNRLVQAFTVGDDPQIDRALVRWDAMASAAHARMLKEIGVLSAAELEALLPELARISAQGIASTFQIPEELEDCHTAIESVLVEKTGAAGQKIHTGRSRNDQVLTAQRLYVRHHVVQTLEALAVCAEALLERADATKDLPMPGYTHLQPAMPSSVGMWFHAFAEAVIDLMGDGIALLGRINTSPLGAASGFGVPLPLDRALTASLLGFDRPQRSVIDVQNSRGRAELKFLRWLSDIGSVVEKFAWDVVLYCCSEFGFFTLPKELTTGSSIMPQKRNPDVAELLRGRAAKLRAAEQELLLVIAKLPSNYHRDFQYTKEPVVRAIDQLQTILPVFTLVVQSVQPQREALQRRMTVELYATYDAFRDVRAGVPFREAYRLSAERYAKGSLTVADLEAEFGSIAAADAAECREARSDLARLIEATDQFAGRFMELEKAVFQAPAA